MRDHKQELFSILPDLAQHLCDEAGCEWHAETLVCAGSKVRDGGRVVKYNGSENYPDGRCTQPLLSCLSGPTRACHGSTDINPVAETDKQIKTISIAVVPSRNNLI